MSPASEILSHFEDTQIMTSFRDRYEEDDNMCLEDESIVII